MANQLNKLPQELLHYIVRLLRYDALTLLNLCLTSRRFTHEAQLHLYANIRIIPFRQALPDRTIIDFDKRKKFLTTIVTHNPSLAKHVRRFVYSLCFPRAPALDLVLRSLRLMTEEPEIRSFGRAICAYESLLGLHFSAHPLPL